MLLPSTSRSLFILFILAILLQVVDIYYWDIFPRNKGYTEAEIESAKQKWQEDSIKAELDFLAAIRGFDPNEVDSIFLSSLGLSPALRNSWLRFLKAGGRFKRKIDLLKLYQLDTALYLKLEPHLRIPSKPDYRNNYADNASEERRLQLRKFDPNKEKQEELIAMGLPRSAVRGIISFREKYRPFKQAEDLFQVFGIDSSLALKMLPYVLLEMPEEAELGVLDINSADSINLCQLPNIGPFTASKILKWRNRLGGFHRMSQLVEHHIFDSIELKELQNYIEIGKHNVWLNLNESSLDELQSHPYINYYLARNIVAFREQVGQYKRVTELMNIELVDDVLFSKLAPYLKVSKVDTLQ